MKTKNLQLKIARLLFIGFLLIFLCSKNLVGQTIPISTYKKRFDIVIPYTIITITTTKAKTKKESKPKQYKVLIKDPIVVKGQLIQDEVSNLDISKLGKGGKGFKIDIGFDSQGNGVLSTINASQEPVTADIIKGAASVTSAVIKTVVGWPLGMENGENILDTTTVQTVTEEKIIYKRSVFLIGDRDVEEIVDLQTHPFQKLNDKVQFVKVKITFTRLTNTENIRKLIEVAKTENDINKNLIIPIKLSQQYSVAITLDGNPDSKFKTEEIANEIVYVPDFGPLYPFPIPILKGKKTVELALNVNTGWPSKFTVNKVSTSKDVFDASENVATKLTEAFVKVEEKHEANEKKKEEKEEENKLEMENQKSKTIKDEIAELMLVKERIDLLNDIKEAQKKLEKKD